ncbi:MAG TPA: hypothetical protein VIQ29_06550 [Ancylobacter sp.]
MPTDARSRPSWAARTFRSLRASLGSTAHVTLTLLVSLAFVLVLATALNYSKFLSTYNGLADRRIVMVTEWTRDSIQVVLNLGLELKGVAAGGNILQAAMNRDPHISSIALFDTASKRIVFSSNPDQIGKPSAEEWLHAQERAAGPHWRLADSDPVIVGIRLDSSVLQNVGGVVLAYSMDDTYRKTAEMRDQLIISSLAIFALFTLVAVIGSLLVTRGLRRTLGGLMIAFDPDASDTAAGARLPSHLIQPAQRFRANAADAEAELAGIERDMALADAHADVLEPRR